MFWPADLDLGQARNKSKEFCRCGISFKWKGYRNEERVIGIKEKKRRLAKKAREP